MKCKLRIDVRIRVSYQLRTRPQRLPSVRAFGAARSSSGTAVTQLVRADIDQLQSRTCPVDPVEYLWPGARESVQSLVTNLSPQLAAANQIFEEVEVEVEEPPVPPQDIVGGQQFPHAGTCQSPEVRTRRQAGCFSARAKPHRRGSRAGRYRQERW